MSTRLFEHFKTVDDFTLLLSTAKQNARSSREHDFLDGLQDKFDTFEAEMYLSENQVRWLRDLAERR